MAESFLARITPVSGPEGPADPDYGIPGVPKPPHAGNPLPVPPLPPGINPPPGWVRPPIALPPPPVALPPIYIDGSPDNTLPPGGIAGQPLPPGGIAKPPIALPPPGTIWPPLNPGDGISGQILALVWLVGIGWKWTVLEAPVIWPQPPTAQPKK